MTWLSRICFSATLAAQAVAATVGGTVQLADSHDPNVRRKSDYSGVVVWLERVGAPQPAASVRTVKIVQKSKRFVPHVSGIPVGTTLSDGTHTFTVTDGRASVDISNWNFASLTVTPPLDFRGDLQVTFTATSTDTATLSTGPASDTTSVTQIIDILIAPDETTYEYLKGRPQAPKGAAWEGADLSRHSQGEGGRKVQGAQTHRSGEER